ncbi:Rv3235 family protein [Micromonospora sp. RTP1Z1]|uniref:Rv3235 family protein n=1 Tax=Micromonospora sp. RTP1Z1 TaxID=2994043 RepID=UPI0029C8E5BB|nr:Rv3235 family protein [Micromonospora sp. RTP1Z1]
MVDTRRPLAPRPPVRLRPAPPLDPPCTDEGEPWFRPGADQLTLDLFDPRRRDPGRPAGRHVDVRPTPTGPGRRAGAPPAALATARPEATRAAHRFVRTFLEIVNGYRPPGQLRPLSDPAEATKIAAELARAARRVAPVRRRSSRPVLGLRRLRVCEPRAGAVEAAAVLTGAGGDSWAIARRLEHRRGNWLCTILQVL